GGGYLNRSVLAVVSFAISQEVKAYATLFLLFRFRARTWVR
ncbi:hypothetical protein A2U01_0104998, partial [Trifolium medium]|nr:hypothetical protein [Trifolium medium]